MEGKVIVCGGDNTLLCYGLASGETHKWHQFATLDNKRQGAASTMLPDGSWWITGGDGYSSASG